MRQDAKRQIFSSMRHTLARRDEMQADGRETMGSKESRGIRRNQESVVVQTVTALTCNVGSNAQGQAMIRQPTLSLDGEQSGDGNYRASPM